MSDHHFLDTYLMRDVIMDMELTDILLRRVKPVIDMKCNKRHLLEGVCEHETNTQGSTDVK
jgi:hypothetical protein